MKTIFDSRVASKTYEDVIYPYYRSADFVVRPGEVAILELTASAVNLCALCFVVYRAPPAPLCPEHSNEKIGKLYRRWGCERTLGSTTTKNAGGATEHTQYNRSVVRLGNDKFNNSIVEFEYIDRPGTYYLLADKSCSDEDVITDCDNPTLVEVSIAPLTTMSNQPCVSYKNSTM